MAKLWVRKPGGAIRRNARRGGSPADVVLRVFRLVAVPTTSGVASANGLRSHPSGSGSSLSRPRSVKVLNRPPARAAHDWLINDAARTGFCGRGMMFSASEAMGD
jgi:hypothetical protein